VSKYRIILASVASTLILSALVIAVSSLAHPALAEDPKTAVCTGGEKPAKAGGAQVLIDADNAWVNARLAEGRTTFTTLPVWNTPGAFVTCAW
jgi:hypothetical protein